MDNHEEIPRPVRPTDGLVILTEFFFNLCQVITTLAESLMELSIYHSNRETKIHKVWKGFSQDLETIQEDTNGA